MTYDSRVNQCMNQMNDPMNKILSSLLNSILMWFGLVWSYDTAVSVNPDESVDSFVCGTHLRKKLNLIYLNIIDISKTIKHIIAFHLGILSSAIALLQNTTFAK